MRNLSCILCQYTESLSLTKQLVDEFADLIGHSSSNISTLSMQEFDSRGQYKNVLEAVREAGDGRARIYRVDHGKTRAEYYVVGFDGKRVVGLKAMAVES